MIAVLREMWPLRGGSNRQVAIQFMVAVLAAMLVLGMTGARLAEAASVKVRPDEANIVSVASQPSAVVVGNPLYAQVMVVTGNKLLVQGRNPGKTNVIVLDSDGREIARFDVVVTGRNAEEIALYRQGKRTTYLCAPLCGQMPNTDDDIDPLSKLNSRISARKSLIDGHIGSN